MPELVSLVEHARSAAEPDPPEQAPVLLVVIDEDGDVGTRAGVLDPPQPLRALRLAVHGGVEGVALEGEDDRDQVRPPVGVGRRQPRDACCS